MDKNLVDPDLSPGWYTEQGVANIRIFEYIRIFSSEYWYSYSIRDYFQSPNNIRIFEYFGPNINEYFA